MAYNGGMAQNKPTKAPLPGRDEKGRFLVRDPRGAPPISPDNAREMIARREQKKREVMLAALAGVVERDDYKVKHGGDAWIAAVAESQYIAATTPDNPKSTAAARFLFDEVGIGASKAAQNDAGAVLGALADVVGALAAFAAAVPGVVDGEIVSSGAGDGSNGFDNYYYDKHDVPGSLPAGDVDGSGGADQAGSEDIGQAGAGGMADDGE